MKKAVVIGLIPGLLVILAGVLTAGLLERQRDVDRTWRDVHAAYRLRIELARELVMVARHEAPRAMTLFGDVIAALDREELRLPSLAPGTLSEAQAIRGAQAVLHGALETTFVRVMNQPELSGNANFRAICERLSANEQALNRALPSYRQATHELALACQTFPHALIGRVLYGHWRGPTEVSSELAMVVLGL